MVLGQDFSPRISSNSFRAGILRIAVRHIDMSRIALMMDMSIVSVSRGIPC